MKLTSSQLRQIIKEELASAMTSKDPQRFLHGFESGHPTDDEGYMIKLRMSDVKEMAETICGLLDEGDQLPAWVQDLVASAHTDLEHVKDYLVGDEKMRGVKESYTAKPGQLASDEEIMDKYGHMMGDLSTPAGQSRVHDRLVKDTMSYDYANYVFDRMQALSAQASPVEESKNSKSFRRGMLLEGHARITPEEMRAWMSGDWGYVAENAGGSDSELDAMSDDELKNYYSDLSKEVTGVRLAAPNDRNKLVKAVVYYQKLAAEQLHEPPEELSNNESSCLQCGALRGHNADCEFNDDAQDLAAALPKTSGMGRRSL